MDKNTNHKIRNYITGFLATSLLNFVLIYGGGFVIFIIAYSRNYTFLFPVGMIGLIIFNIFLIRKIYRRGDKDFAVGMILGTLLPLLNLGSCSLSLFK